MKLDKDENIENTKSKREAKAEMNYKENQISNPKTIKKQLKLKLKLKTRKTKTSEIKYQWEKKIKTTKIPTKQIK